MTIEKVCLRNHISIQSNNFNNCIGWRTDFKEFSKTIGAEFNRKRILKSSYKFSRNEIEENFLFQEMYKKIKKNIND